MLLRISANLVDRTIELVQKPLGSPPASLRISVDGRLGLV